MKENVGGWDRVGRAMVGPALLGLGYGVLGGRRGALGGIAAMIGGALVTETALTRVCPVNEWLGVDTARRIELAE
jgi:6-phosphogluconate dehydrogenase